MAQVDPSAGGARERQVAGDDDLLRLGGASGDAKGGGHHTFVHVPTLDE